ncbi:MAG: hypothetical protein EXS25_12620 [Pedosphaera sp.]|nr:hypothetical protein [Pedosphaera sp.]
MKAFCRSQIPNVVNSAITVGLLSSLVILLVRGAMIAAPQLSWGLVIGVPEGDKMDKFWKGPLQMILGTVCRVFLMTLFMISAGVLTCGLKLVTVLLRAHRSTPERF